VSCSVAHTESESLFQAGCHGNGRHGESGAVASQVMGMDAVLDAFSDDGNEEGDEGQKQQVSD
jgi:hypothetical protein